MNYAWYDVAGSLGVALIVIGYVLLQAEKIRSTQLTYSLMNATGALLIIVSLIHRFNFSAFLVECFWLLISLYGLIRLLWRRQAGANR